jgi:hypothetical protein
MKDAELARACWRRNTVVGGLELVVAHRPGSDLDERLEHSGWRWSRSIQSWYHRDTPEAVEFARDLCASLRRSRPR